MLPKSRRLTRQQFWQVSKQGFTIYDSRFTIKYLSNDVGNSRWAVVTSARLDKRAVVRNRLRRKIYKTLGFSGRAGPGFAGGIWDFPAEPDPALPGGFDIIIFPKPSVINLSDAQISTRLDQVVSKIPRPS